MSKAGERHDFETHLNFAQGEPDKKYYIALALVVNGNLQAISDLVEFCAETTGVDDIQSGDARLTFDGSTLKADGHDIEVYNMQGIRVLGGEGSVSTGMLLPGMYVARAGNRTLKFTVR